MQKNKCTPSPWVPVDVIDPPEIDDYNRLENVVWSLVRGRGYSAVDFAHNDPETRTALLKFIAWAEWAMSYEDDMPDGLDEFDRKSNTMRFIEFTSCKRTTCRFWVNSRRLPIGNITDGFPGECSADRLEVDETGSCSNYETDACSDCIQPGGQS